MLCFFAKALRGSRRHGDIREVVQCFHSSIEGQKCAKISDLLTHRCGELAIRGQMQTCVDRASAFLTAFAIIVTAYQAKDARTSRQVAGTLSFIPSGTVAQGAADFGGTAYVSF